MAEPTPAELRRLILEVVEIYAGDPVPVDFLEYAVSRRAPHPLPRRRVARNVSELVRRGELRYVTEDYRNAAGNMDYRTVGVIRA